MQKLAWLGCAVAFALLAIPIAHSIPFFMEVPLGNWASFNWSPDENSFGLILALAGSSLLVVVTLPLVLLTAWPLGWQIYSCESSWLKALSLSILQTLNALPSVAIGIWGISQIIPLARSVSGTGYGLFSTVIVMTVMIVPAAAILFLEAIKNFKRCYGPLERSLGLNFAESTLFFLKSSRSDLRHLVIHIFCRVLGETTIVLMLSGNSLMLPKNLFSGFRTMTSSIALEMAYSSGMHEHALYALAAFSILALFTVLSRGRRDVLA